MPTRDRLSFLPGAFECFRSQTYPLRLRELLLGDDGAAPPSIPDDLPIGYIRIEPPCTIGAKRNILCDLARGSIIVHWDDDDYSAPERIDSQVRRLLSSGAQVTGYNRMEFRGPNGGRWMYSGAAQYALGTSLCYRREWWAAHKFPEYQVGEDTEFVQRARPHLVATDAEGMMYATIHGGNTSRKTESVLKQHAWRRIA
jgi:hypothetical protein